MSTRYVWGKYNATANPGSLLENFWGYSFIHEGYEDAYDAFAGTGGTVYYASSFTIIDNSDPYFAKVKLTNPKTATLPLSGSGTVNVPAGNYYALSDTFYAAKSPAIDLINNQSNDESSYDELYYMTYSENDNGDSVSSFTVGRYASTNLQVFSKSANGDQNGMPIDTATGGWGTTYVATVSTGKGTFVSYASSSYNRYSNGVNSDGYYYSYIGTDNVDPTAVSISSPSLNAGSNAIMAVTPRTTTYGTLRYTYQYSANNGTWTTVSSYNTATSYTFTIPNGTTTIKVRVQVSDNIGFYSSDYVTSDPYSVNSYTIYTSVSGAIKGVNPVVAVGGGGTFRKGCCLQRRSYQDSVNHYNYACLVDIA